MRKLFKICAILLAIGAIAYFGSPYVPLIVTAKNLTPVHRFDEDLRLSITITNYTPVPKEIYLSQSNSPESVVLYIDSPTKPTPAITAKKDALATLTLPYFGHHMITRSFTLRSSAKADPQIIWGDAGELTLTPDSHTYYIAWDGYVSDKQTFNVQ